MSFQIKYYFPHIKSFTVELITGSTVCQNTEKANAKHTRRHKWEMQTKVPVFENTRACCWAKEIQAGKLFILVFEKAPFGNVKSSPFWKLKIYFYTETISSSDIQTEGFRFPCQGTWFPRSSEPNINLSRGQSVETWWDIAYSIHHDLVILKTYHLDIIRWNLSSLTVFLPWLA